MELKTTELKINEKYGRLADEKSVKAAAKALEKNNIKVIIAMDAVSAKAEAEKLIPEKSEVMNMASATLAQLGLDKEILESEKWRAVKNILNGMGDEGKMEKQRLGAAPEYAIGSVHAVTESGEVMIASKTGSQLPAYAYGALNVVWIVGAQKIVKNIDEGMKRIYEYTLPLEKERAMKAYGITSAVNKILIINKEDIPGRITMILVKEKLGF